MAKLKSSKKVLIASLLVGVLVLGAVVSLILVLAAPQQNVKTNVKVSYVVDGVGAKVSAKYHIVNPTSGVVANSVSLSSEEDKEELEFEVSDDESDPAKTLNPKTTDPVQLTSTTSMIVYEYAFTNTTTAPFIVLLSGEPSDVENMDISYRSTGSKLTNFVGNFEETSPKAQLVINKDQTIYFYIGVRVSELNKGANYSGNIEWTITHVQDSALKTLTLDNGDAGETTLKYLPDVQLPHLSSVPIGSDANKVFAGYYASANGVGTQYYDASGSSLTSLTTTETTLYAHYAEAYQVSATGELTGLTETGKTAAILSIPETVTTINSGVLNNTRATTINLPNTVTTIGEGAFEGNSTVEEIVVGNGTTTAAYANESITIGANAFNGCISLQKLILSEGIVSIGAKAIFNCLSLKELIIPEGVTSIGAGALQNLKSVEHIVIPSTVTGRVYGVMKGCDNLKKLECSADFIGGSDNYGDGYATSGLSTLFCYTSWDYNYETGNNEATKEGDTPSTLKDIIINGGDTIYGGAFAYEELDSVILPNTITKLEHNELYGNVSYEYEGAFSGATINNLILPEVSLEIGNYAFYYFTSINNLTINIGGSALGNSAFYECSSLTSITIPNSVTSIGSSAFSYCDSLVQVRNLSGLTLDGYTAPSYAEIKTDNSAFNSTVEIGEKYAIFTNGVNKILLYATDKIITNANDLPSDLTQINQFAFYECTSLTSVTIPSSVKSIGSYAFAFCESLTSITISKGVTSIKEMAFYCCKSLTEVTIPNSVTSIGSSAFSDCYSLVKVRNLSGQTLKGYTAPSYAEIKTDNTEFSSTLEIGEKYAIFTNGANKILLYATDKTITNANDLPSDLTQINQYAFDDCTSLTSVTIPSSVTSIGKRAFGSCNYLESVTFDTTEGWWYASSETATSGKSLSSTDLADTSTAAKYLRSTYYSKYWKRG